MDSSATAFDPMRWILDNFKPQLVDTPRFLYNHQSSQSGQCLPVIYEPFDPAKPSHFIDRGDILDYAYHAHGGRVLDFGPGDGWPSLPMARYCKEVVGVDASQRRVDECTANAKRLGITNARFILAETGSPLPFADGEFDAVVAASSVEQTPNPTAVLKELHRVLKPGGTLRLWYEGLACYRGVQERDAWVLADGAAPSHVFYVYRDIAAEQARQWRLSVDMDSEHIAEVFAEHGLSSDYPELSPSLLKTLKPKVIEAAECVTQHPSCATWLKMLAGAGFSSAHPMYGGRNIARHMFYQLDAGNLPKSIEQTDALLRAPVHAVVQLAAPIEIDPMITATK